MEAVQCEGRTGLSPWGYVKLFFRTAIASFTATILIILLVFEDRVAINLLMFLDPETQVLFAYILGIMAVSNLLAMLAIQIE